MKLLEVYVCFPPLVVIANRLIFLLSPFQAEDEGAPRRAAGARRGANPYLMYLWLTCRTACTPLCMPYGPIGLRGKLNHLVGAHTYTPRYCSACCLICY